jgi:hypothetical protein
MDYVKPTDVLLLMNNDPRSAHIPSSSDHNNVSGFKLDEFGYFSQFEVKLDRVVDVDKRVWVADRTSIMSNDVRDTFRADGDLANFQQFVGSFFFCDAMHSEATLDVVKQTKKFVRFLNGNHVYNQLSLDSRILQSKQR